MIGDNASNIMTGLNGTDVMVGSIGDDAMSGGNRSDQIIGHEGADNISGGDGSDEIIEEIQEMIGSRRKRSRWKFWEERETILFLETMGPTLLWVELLMT